MRFDDVWMQPWQLEKLASLAASSCKEGSAAVEIGVHQGYSAIPIASAIYPITLHAVDHWEGSTDFSQEMCERDNFSIFTSNVKEGSKTNIHIPNIHIHRQGWREFVRYWTDSIGFLHLDAEHTKEEVSDQIVAFLPYMIEGSIMAGDDYNWPGVRDGVSVHFTYQQVNVMRNKLWWVEF